MSKIILFCISTFLVLGSSYLLITQNILTLLSITMIPYLIGSIPFGFLLTKFSGLGDIRTFGSGNIGATNVLRTGNKKIALGTLLGDLLKGLLYTFIATHFIKDPQQLFLIASFLVLGHITCPWLGFKGGKGVATAVGTYFALSPLLAIMALFFWLLSAKIFKISSLSALLGSLLSALSFWILLKTHIIVSNPMTLMSGWYAVFITIVLLITHRDNIQRLINGTESPIHISKES